MIEKCNFRLNKKPALCTIQTESSAFTGMLGTRNRLCVEEDNCILYQIYRNTLSRNSLYQPQITEI